MSLKLSCVLPVSVVGFYVPKPARLRRERKYVGIEVENLNNTTKGEFVTEGPINHLNDLNNDLNSKDLVQSTAALLEQARAFNEDFHKQFTEIHQQQNGISTAILGDQQSHNQTNGELPETIAQIARRVEHKHQADADRFHQEITGKTPERIKKEREQKIEELRVPKSKEEIAVARKNEKATPPAAKDEAAIEAIEDEAAGGNSSNERDGTAAETEGTAASAGKTGKTVTRENSTPKLTSKAQYGLKKTATSMEATPDLKSAVTNNKLTTQFKEAPGMTQRNEEAHGMTKQANTVANKHDRGITQANKHDQENQENQADSSAGATQTSANASPASVEHGDTEVETIENNDGLEHWINEVETPKSTASLAARTVGLSSRRIAVG